MRTGIRDALKEIDNWCQARITEPLVVERASARGLELRPVEGVAINLAVIELDGVDGLVGRQVFESGDMRHLCRVAHSCTRKKKLEIVQLWRCSSCKRVFTPGPAAMHNKTYPLRMTLDGETRRALFFVKARGCLFERVAEVVIGER